MQILLTREEYEEFSNVAKVEAGLVRAKLETACKLIATKVPLDPPPWEGFGVKPWGCRHVTGDLAMVCDECPACEFCPLPQAWSK